MVQVLHYAARYGKLNEELTMRIGHLSEYVKNFQPVIYRLLVKCYEAYLAMIWWIISANIL